MSPLEQLKAEIAGTVVVDSTGNGLDSSKAQLAFQKFHPLTTEQREAGREYEAGALDLFARETVKPMIDVMKRNKDIAFLTSGIRDGRLELGISMARPEGDNVTREQYAAGVAIYHRTELNSTTVDIANELAGLMME